MAKFLMPGRDPGGMIVTMALGVAGSFIAGLVGRALGMYQEGEPVGFIASVIGAILLLAIYRMFTRNRHRHV
ncbi:MAG TPA: GlsB/YeaQ/YmgE family stress response membrane protein [Prosthecobacter sp.]|nr:GlsB/YeaQ/YmgE family stress response membrane protein [Prosthecobacter sp.]